MIEVRLDRALVSYDFLNLFTEAKLINLEVSTSDHSPILLELHKSVVLPPTKKFRFENAWLRELMCHQIVAEVWINGTDMSLFEKLKDCSNILSSWGHQITGNFRQRIQRCKKILKTLKGRKDSNSREMAKEEQNNLSKIYVQQKIFWRQRSKQLWLREGDQNTRFFHSSTKNRRVMNQIRSLRNDQG